ncbi:MAG TPA: L-threonylcarbamoyladenylate synthase [Candidatus Limnocylindria bacterium]|nr:L-threonylcarbamoyladenylate synthase [Candidatus Limnocylindria bacterium]
MTDRLPATEEGLQRAATILRDGGIVAFPTDTVYGVGCAAARPEAVAAIFALKRRRVDRLIPILVSGLDGVSGDAWEVDQRARALAEALWPGALTLVLPARESGGSQAFRAPDHRVALALIEGAGPLYVTSANVSDEPETLDADDVLIAFATQADELAAVVDGGRVTGGIASTVLDLTVTPARIAREGPISRDALAAIIDLQPVD